MVKRVIIALLISCVFVLPVYAIEDITEDASTISSEESTTLTTEETTTPIDTDSDNTPIIRYSIIMGFSLYTIVSLIGYGIYKSVHLITN